MESSQLKCESVSYSVMSDSCVPMDCSPPGSSVHGIPQARILGVGCQDLPNVGIKPMSLTSPALAGRFFTTSTTREAHKT